MSTTYYAAAVVGYTVAYGSTGTWVPPCADPTHPPSKEGRQCCVVCGGAYGVGYTRYLDHTNLPAGLFYVLDDDNIRPMEGLPKVFLGQMFLAGVGTPTVIDVDLIEVRRRVDACMAERAIQPISGFGIHLLLKRELSREKL